MAIVTSSYIPPIRTNILYPNDTQSAFDPKSQLARPILKVIKDTITKVLGVGAGLSTSGTLAPAGLGLAINYTRRWRFIVLLL